MHSTPRRLSSFSTQTLGQFPESREIWLDIPGSHSGPLRGPAVAMVSALAPLRLVPAGVVQVSISRSCLAAVDVARGCQPPRDSGAADGGVGIGSVVASLFSRLISHFERVPACVLHSVEHSIWLSATPMAPSVHLPGA